MHRCTTATLRSLFLLLLLASCRAPATSEVAPTPARDLPATTASGVPRVAPASEARGTDQAPAEAATPAKPLLVLTTTVDGAMLGLLRELAEEFGSGSRFAVQVAGKNPGDLALDAEMAALAEQGADLSWIGGEELGSLVRTELYQPVDGLLAASDLVSSTVTAGSIAGVQWGVPVSAGRHLVLLYNKRLVPQPPRTTAELLNLARPEGVEAILVANQDEPRWFVPWLHGFGGEFFTTENRPALNTPAMIATLKLLKALRDREIVRPDVDIASGDALFRSGGAAMLIDDDRAVATYTGIEGLDLGVAALPAITETNRLAAPYASGDYLLLGRSLSGDRLEAAQAFARFVTGEAVQLRIAREARQLPALTSALQAAEVQDDPLLRPISEALAAAVPERRDDVAILWGIIQPYIAQALSGEKEAEVAAQEMQSAAEAAFNSP